VKGDDITSEITTADPQLPGQDALKPPLHKDQNVSSFATGLLSQGLGVDPQHTYFTHAASHRR